MGTVRVTGADMPEPTSGGFRRTGSGVRSIARGARTVVRVQTRTRGGTRPRPTAQGTHSPPLCPGLFFRCGTTSRPNRNHTFTSTDQGGSLRGGGGGVPERQFCKKTACSSYVQPWLVAIGGWRLVAIGGWLAVGDWRLVAVGAGWWWVIGGWWRLAVVGGWWSLGAVPKGGP